MGKPMARNLRRAGYDVVVHNRSRPAVEALLAEGAGDGRSPRGVAESCETVITMLPDSVDVRQVVLGADGVLEGLRPGSVLIDMSTISPLVTKEIAVAVEGRGATMIDAPVSGGEKGAIEATLSIMIGGPVAAVAKVRSIFEALGKNIVRIGEVGAGQVAKACNQIVVAVTIQAVSEALTLARKAGVDPARVREALLGGFAQSRILDAHGQRILDRNFAPGFRVRLHQKDLGIALDTGKATGTPLLATALVHEVFGALRAQGMEDLDHSAIARFVERQAGLESV
jgi:2-hydroxy-3-oxopropionate reductase